MAITPDTNIKLLKCPLNLSNKNQLTFSSKTAQYNYFNGLTKIEIDECSYQRKDNIIRYPAHIDSIIEYNYCMYQNSNYGDKWFYAYITNMTYENDGLTNITIETDAFQTWQFDINFKDSFVEREHVNNDTIGLHTIDENLNMGTAVQKGYMEEDTALSSWGWVAIMSSYDPKNGDQFQGISIINGNVFGKEVYLVNTNPTSNLVNLLKFILKANADGHIEDISDMFIIPAPLVDQSKIEQVIFDSPDGSTGTVYKMPFSTDDVNYDITTEKRYNFSDYTPKNNKCFCYPYNYLFVSNNSGNSNIYKYEDFSSDDGLCHFNIQLALGIGVSGRAVPRNYKGSGLNDDEALPLAKYPVCGWSADSYTNWLTQNAVNLPTQILSNVLGTGQNIISSSDNPKTISIADSSNIVSTVGNVVTNIAGTIGQFYSASLLPNIEGGGNTGDVNYSAKRNTFTIRHMGAKKEYIEVIDNFFTMYGYKVNVVKTPNLTGRSNWNYVKTIDCNITANIPQMDLLTIKEIFDAGVTLWHNPSTFLDYSQNNSIV